MRTEAEQLALEEFPSLVHLIELRDVGWRFDVTVIDGSIAGVHGTLTWTGGWVDAVRVRYATDAAALRCDSTGGIVWKESGTLADVCEALLSLPPPHHPLAPRLVKGWL